MNDDVYKSKKCMMTKCDTGSSLCKYNHVLRALGNPSSSSCQRLTTDECARAQSRLMVVSSDALQKAARKHDDHDERMVALWTAMARVGRLNRRI